MRSFAPPRFASADRKPADRPRRPAIGAGPARAPRHFSGGTVARREEPTPAAPRLPAAGGLPERLQTVMEAMSGFSLADVVVHRNSAESVRLGAAAFTRGNQIHLAPGQERHLAHEAWHAVQQKQGRVSATRQYKGAAINDDSALEREADAMGARAVARPGSQAGPAPAEPARVRPGGTVIQAKEVEPTYAGSTKPTTVSLKLAVGDYPPFGSGPGQASPDGWKEIAALGLSDSWVRFHVLNERSGGKGTEGNLAPTTGNVNKCSPWKKFETTLKLFVDPEHRYGTGAPFGSTFDASVTYYTSSEDCVYKKDATSVSLKGADFPAKIAASLDVDKIGKYTASLSDTDGLVAPNKIAPVGWS